MFSQRENTHWFKQAPWKELSGTLHCIPHPCAGLHILTHKEIFHVSKRQWPQNEKGIWGAHTFEFPGCILLPWLDFSVVCAPGQWFPIKPFGVCKGLSVRSMNHAKSCLLVRGWPAELHQGSEGALLCSLWFEMLIREVSNSELAEADRRTEDVGAGCSSPLFHYPMKTGRNESLRRGTWRVKGKPDLSELLQPG